MNPRKPDKAVILYMCFAALLILGILHVEELLSWAGGLWSVMTPLVFGLAAAYVLNIVLVRVERLYFPHSKSRLVKGSRRGVCIVLSILLVFAVFLLVGRLVLPELVKTFGVIGRSVPAFLERTVVWLEENSTREGAEELAQALEQIDWENMGSRLLAFARSGISSVLNSTLSAVGSVVGAVVNFFIGMIFGVYILSSKERLRSQAKRMLNAYLKPAAVERLRRIYHTANETFSSFIIGQCTEAVILGTLCTVGMLIFRFPYAPMIGAFVGATALIPIVGAYLGAGVGAFMILTTDPLKALLFILFIVVLQQLEGNLIYPKVVGSSIGLPGMWVLAAVTVGGGLMGIGGMLLGVPVAATLYKLVGNDVKRRNGGEREASQRRN